MIHPIFSFLHPGHSPTTPPSPPVRHRSTEARRHSKCCVRVETGYCAAPGPSPVFNLHISSAPRENPSGGCPQSISPAKHRMGAVISSPNVSDIEALK